jgi:hypothetical protein
VINEALSFSPMFNPKTPSDTNLSTLLSLFTSKNWKFLIVEFRI